jgi:hypothetical protein
MTETRYNRWQGLAMAQFSVAIALISGLSISGLAVGFTLLQNKDFTPGGNIKLAFALSFPLLLLAAFFSSGAVISRTLDFRLTARKVRKDQNSNYARKLTWFGLGADCYGCISWFLFWFSCLALFAGVTLLVVSIAATYRGRLW